VAEQKLTDTQDHNKKVRIVIADDHPLLREALRYTLEKQCDFEIVAECGDGEETLRMARELIPDVLVMDISMPKLNGMEVTKQIKAESLPIAILVLTVHNDNEHVISILEAGAAGYLTKSVYGDEIINSVRALVSGETVLSSSISAQVFKYAYQHMPKSVTLQPFDRLLARELEILKLAAKGTSNKDIAAKLGLSLRTVKGYLSDIFSKLMVASRTEAIIVSLRKGIIDLKDLE
jgi:two-component system, NarL family, response regulator LiaR